MHWAQCCNILCFRFSFSVSGPHGLKHSDLSVASSGTSTKGNRRGRQMFGDTCFVCALNYSDWFSSCVLWLYCSISAWRAEPTASHRPSCGTLCIAMWMMNIRCDWPLTTRILRSGHVPLPRWLVVIRLVCQPLLLQTPTGEDVRFGPWGSWLLGRTRFISAPQYRTLPYHWWFTQCFSHVVTTEPDHHWCCCLWTRSLQKCLPDFQTINNVSWYRAWCRNSFQNNFNHFQSLSFSVQPVSPKTCIAIMLFTTQARWGGNNCCQPLWDHKFWAIISVDNTFSFWQSAKCWNDFGCISCK